MSPGDVRFLGIILECSRARARLLGLDQPVEMRIQGRLSIEDIRQILAAAADESDETETVQ
jgi:hypothetical protein